MRILRCEEGLTLVETIIALVLMLGLLAAFAGAMVVGLQSEVEVDKRLEASNLASGIIEFLGDGNELKNIVEDTDGNHLEEVTLYINNNYELYNNDLSINTEELDSDLFFNGIRLNESSESSEIILKKHSDDDNLYEVKINIVWDDRDNKWSNNLVTLLAVD